MLQANNVSLSRGGNLLLDCVSMSLESGELLMVLGPNGAGKSTLLSCLSGAVHGDAGEILLEAKPLSAFPIETLAKKRAVLTQQVTMVFNFTVEQVVSLGLAPWSLGVKQADELIQRTLMDVGLPNMQKRDYNSLSGGEQQRAQLARVLVQLLAGNDDLSGCYLLLDEPIAALDLEQQQRVLRLLKTLSAKGLAVLCVIHDINLAALYGDRLVLLDNGRLMFQGKPADLTAKPYIESAYQADLIRLHHAQMAVPQWQFQV
ncbi:heme ABC transporter ATP-binding protein [Marinomonas transparens]|uniref:Heme ABC transporter ATP-binding protein n=1 Tax=Marinomonas transparens TaxID=2795388 RepID=A0A934N1N1_9GAMM|nr:heme ABC transporter ATP-binding protein [Marinomonas transparens]MBJ7537922.1 heme ABC transporter ATP-binding protein [Marinomonas transparens]